MSVCVCVCTLPLPLYVRIDLSIICDVEHQFNPERDYGRLSDFGHVITNGGPVDEKWTALT